MMHYVPPKLVPFCRGRRSICWSRLMHTNLAGLDSTPCPIVVCFSRWYTTSANWNCRHKLQTTQSVYMLCSFIIFHVSIFIFFRHFEKYTGSWCLNAGCDVISGISGQFWRKIVALRPYGLANGGQSRRLIATIQVHNNSNNTYKTIVLLHVRACGTTSDHFSTIPISLAFA